jgi:alpha-galactosidase
MAISVNQDPLGIQGYSQWKKDSIELWVKPLEGEKWAACFLNRGKEPVELEFNWEEHGFMDKLSGRSADFRAKSYRFVNVWVQKQKGSTKKPLIASLGGHDVLMLILSED